MLQYILRERDRRVEVDRGVAIERMRQLIDALEGLEAEATEWAVRVRSERSPASVGAAAWCRSSVRRELEFLLSHTVHHYALIVELLRLQEVELDERFAEFGVAPSTLDYWRESGSNAG